jgi:hypothetical protein
MGTSFTSYRNRGFWSPDGSIELWLYLLCEEARGLEVVPEWLHEACEDWMVQATAGMMGSISVGLDDYASTPERTDLIIKLSARALAGLRARGSVLPLVWLNSLGLGGPGSYFTSDLLVDGFIQLGETFIKLLRGELTWDAASSPVIGRAT